MTKRSDTSLMIAFLDLQLAGVPVNACSKRLQLHVSTIYRWIDQSAKPEHASKYTFEYGDWGSNTLIGHLAAIVGPARRFGLNSEADARALGESEALFEDVFFQGKRKFKVRDEVIKMGYNEDTDPQTLFLMFGKFHPFEEDERGNLVPERARRAASENLLTKVLAARDPKNWTERKDVSLTVGGGVKVLTQQAPAPMPVIDVTPEPAPMIAPVDAARLPKPVVLAPPVELQPDPDADLAEMVGNSTPADKPGAAPAPVPAEAPPADEEAAKAARKAKITAHYAQFMTVKNPRPTGQVNTGNAGSSPNDPVERGA